MADHEGTPVSDENFAGEATPPVTPPARGAFDWLRESHQQLASSSPAPTEPSVPAQPNPLLGETPVPPSSPVFQQTPAPPIPPAAPTFPQQRPIGSAQQQQPVSAPSHTEPSTAPPFGQPVGTPSYTEPYPQPAFQAPPPVPVPSAPPSEPSLIPRPEFMSQLPTAYPSASSPTVSSSPAVSSAPVASAGSFPFAGLAPSSRDDEPQSLTASSFGGTGFQLERHQSSRRPTNSPFDISALVLAVVLPPIGLIVSIVTAVIESRSRGYTVGLVKAAIAIAVVLSIALGVGGAVLAKVSGDQAAHAALVASSRSWCTKLQANPATLQSDTFGWPAPADTIPDSMTSIATYVSFWKSLVAIAPSGIKGGTQQVESAAQSIYSSVKSTQTLDNAANVSNMQDAAASSGVQSWVTQYCH